MASRGGARANDGTLSTASLVVGVAATEAARQDVPVAGRGATLYSEHISNDVGAVKRHVRISGS